MSSQIQNRRLCLKTIGNSTIATTRGSLPGVEGPSSNTTSLLNPIIGGFVSTVLCALIVASLFHVWKFDWRVPLNTDGDAHFHQMLIKNFVEGGHYYVNPRLGAPEEQKLYDFPQPSWTHVMVWAVLRLFTHDFGLLLNLYYFITYPLCGLAAFYAFYRLGISTGPAIAGSVVLAYLPFHFFRSESHLFYGTIYTLPLSGLVILWLAVGNPLFGFELPSDVLSRPLITRDGLIAIACCVLVAWDNPYAAFFTAGLLLIAGLLGTFRNGHRRSLAAAFLMLTVLSAALVTALLPNILYFHKYGRVAGVAIRFPWESELSPLRLMELFAPIRGHRFLNNLRQYFDLNDPLPSEGWTDSIGILATIGFFVSLASLFRKRCSDFIYSLGILNLWAVLVGTMGGFGAIFAFVISPQIRAYNRISIFVGFFSITALVWALDRWLRARFPKARFVSLVLVPVLLITICVLDQIPRHVLRDRNVYVAEYKEQTAFIGRIEASVPPGSMIFQLPYMFFPEHGPVNKMGDYDPVIAYLHSKTLRWSYGAMHNRPADRWQAAVAVEPPDRMIKTLTDAGFAGIFIDRLGYTDNGVALEAQLRTLLHSEPITDSHGRYLFFRLDHQT